MAPAPKSRVPKGKIVEEPPTLSAVPQGELVGVDSDSQEPKAPKDVPVTMSRRRSSLEAPPLRFQLRKPTAGKDSEPQVGWVTQRGATDEIREHLKHLGPSNLASRPRHTRYQNVKIKRGGLSPTRFSHSDIDPHRPLSEASPSTSLGLNGGIGAGVLHSAGMDARDGVHALKLGYGTMSPDGDKPKYEESPDIANGIVSISVPEPVSEEQDDSQSSKQPLRETAASSIHSGASQSEERPKPGNYRHPGPARSGSITEQVIDVNGVRKVVLHTTSSSDGDEQRNSPPSRGSVQYNSKTNLSSGDSKNAFNAGTSSSASAKKKRRRKKRGGQRAKDTEDQPNEQQPLLS